MPGGSLNKEVAKVAKARCVGDLVAALLGSKSTSRFPTQVVPRELLRTGHFVA